MRFGSIVPVDHIPNPFDCRSSIISAGVYPQAYRPPTIAPIDVPATKSMGMSLSSSAWITPMWAIPLAPPPLNTSPTDWSERTVAVVSEASGEAAAIPAISKATSDAMNLIWRRRLAG